MERETKACLAVLKVDLIEFTVSLKDLAELHVVKFFSFVSKSNKGNNKLNTYISSHSLYLPFAEDSVLFVWNWKFKNIKHSSESWERELSAFGFILIGD